MILQHVRYLPQQHLAECIEVDVCFIMFMPKLLPLYVFIIIFFFSQTFLPFVYAFFVCVSLSMSVCGKGNLNVRRGK